MPNRYQSGQKQEIYDTIARYEGEYCMPCFVEGAGRRSPPSVKLQIDHAGRERHLVCQTHNLKFRRLSLEEHESLMAEHSAVNVRERIKRGEFISEVREKVDYMEGSTEMKAHAIIFNKWLRFMNEWILENDFITEDKAKYGGAYVSGGSPSTTEKYIKTYISLEDCPFKREVREGIKVITFRSTKHKAYIQDILNKANGNGHKKVSLAKNGTGKVVIAEPAPTSYT